MRWAAVLAMIAVGAGMWCLAVNGAPETRPAATAGAAQVEAATPDDAIARAHAETVAKAQEKMHETLGPKLELRAAAIKRANDAFLPAAKTAFEALEDVRKKSETDAVAAYDARIREITKTGDLDGALAIKGAKEKFQAWAPQEADRLLTDFRALTDVDPDKAGLLAQGDENFKIKQVKVVAFDKDVENFRKQLKICFPERNNLSRTGTATASSTHPNVDDPNTTLGSARRSDTWAVADGDTKKWYAATWEKPVAGQYIFILGRPIGPSDGNSWGNARLQINELPPVTIADMAQMRAIFIELDRVALIHSLKIEFGNSISPGMCDLEIHREMKAPFPGETK